MMIATIYIRTRTVQASQAGRKRHLGLSRRSKVVRHSLDGESMLRYVHDWYTRNFTNTTFQVAITGGHDVAFVLHDSVNQTIVGIRAFMIARQTLEGRVLEQSQGYTILRAHLFQLADDTFRNAGDTFGVQAVHHPLGQIDFVTNGEVDKVSVDEHSIWRSQLSVVLEKESRRHLRNAADFLLLLLLSSFRSLNLITLDPHILRIDNFLYCSKLPPHKFLRLLVLRTAHGERDTGNTGFHRKQETHTRNEIIEKCTQQCQTASWMKLFYFLAQRLYVYFRQTGFSASDT